MTESKLICPNCGDAIAQDDIFCGACGSNLTNNHPHEKEEQTDKDYAALLLKGFKGYFLQQDDFAAINRAKELFEQAIETDPERPEAYLGLGLCYYIFGQDEAALTHIEMGLVNGFGVDDRYESILFEYSPDEDGPDDPFVFELGIEALIMHRAIIHMNMGNLELATQDLDGIFDNIPEEYNAEKHAIRAEIALRSEDMENAKRHIEKALSLDPDSSYTHSICGFLYLEEDNAQAAINSLSRALSIDPMVPETLMARAKAFHAIGVTDKMKTDIQNVRHIIQEGYSNIELKEDLNALETKFAQSKKQTEN